MQSLNFPILSSSKQQSLDRPPLELSCNIPSNSSARASDSGDSNSSGPDTSSSSQRSVCLNNSGAVESFKGEEAGFFCNRGSKASGGAGSSRSFSNPLKLSSTISEASCISSLGKPSNFPSRNFQQLPDFDVRQDDVRPHCVSTVMSSCSAQRCDNNYGDNSEALVAAALDGNDLLSSQCATPSTKANVAFVYSCGSGNVSASGTLVNSKSLEHSTNDVSGDIVNQCNSLSQVGLMKPVTSMEITPRPTENHSEQFFPSSSATASSKVEFSYDFHTPCGSGFNLHSSYKSLDESHDVRPSLQVIPMVLESLNRSQLAVPDLPPRPDSNSSAMSVNFIFPEPINQEASTHKNESTVASELSLAFDSSHSVSSSFELKQDSSLTAESAIESGYVVFNNRKLSVSELSDPRSECGRKKPQIQGLGVPTIETNEVETSPLLKEILPEIPNCNQDSNDLPNTESTALMVAPENSLKKDKESSKSKLDSLLSKFFPRSKNNKKKNPNTRGVSQMPTVPLPPIFASSSFSSLTSQLSGSASPPSTASKTSLPSCPVDRSTIIFNNNNINLPENKRDERSIQSTSNATHDTTNNNNNSSNCTDTNSSQPLHRSASSKQRKSSLSKSKHRRRKKNTSSFS